MVLLNNMNIDRTIIYSLSLELSQKERKQLEEKVWDACKDGTVSYCGVLFEKLGELSKGTPFDTIIRDLTEKRLGWDSTFYSQIPLSAEPTDVAVRVEKGTFKCRNKDCQSDECYFTQVQTRSLDEGGTVYVICTKCGGQFRV